MPRIPVEKVSTRLLVIISLLLLFAATLTAIYNSEKDHEQAIIKREEDFLRSIIDVAATQIYDQLKEDTTTIGSQLVAQSEFKQTFKEALIRLDGGIESLEEVLNEPFINGYINAATVTLEALRIYDQEWKLLAQGRTKSEVNIDDYPLSEEPTPIVREAAKRTGRERLRMFAGKWLSQHDPFYSIIIPIGGLRVQGYLEIIVNPSLSLQKLGQLIGHEIDTINLVSGESILPEHLKPNQLETFHVVTHDLLSLHGKPMYTVRIFVDNAEFMANVHRNQYQAIILGGMMSLIVLLIVVSLLEALLIRPIAKLRHDIHQQTQQPSDTPVSTTGLSEFHQLAQDFNHLLRISKRQSEALESLSLTDELTQLPNRRAMKRFMATTSSNVVRNKEPISVIMMDIDYFKQFNDAYGHDGGDACLRNVARAIEDALPRTTDFVARYGGEEFVVILPDTTAGGAYQVAERIAESVRQIRIAHKQSAVADFVTLSLGLAGCASATSGCIEILLKQADENLYKAKELGRNRIFVN